MVSEVKNNLANTAEILFLKEIYDFAPSLNVACEALRKVVDVRYISAIKVKGPNAGEIRHLLKREFPKAEIIFEDCENSKNLWEISPINQEKHICVCVIHNPDEVFNISRAFNEYARISAKRDIGSGRSLSIFGKELLSPMFAPAMRGVVSA